MNIMYYEKDPVDDAVQMAAEDCWQTIVETDAATVQYRRGDFWDIEVSDGWDWLITGDSIENASDGLPQWPHGQAANDDDLVADWLDAMGYEAYAYDLSAIVGANDIGQHDVLFVWRAPSL